MSRPPRYLFVVVMPSLCGKSTLARDHPDVFLDIDEFYGDLRMRDLLMAKRFQFDDETHDRDTRVMRRIALKCDGSKILLVHAEVQLERIQRTLNEIHVGGVKGYWPHYSKDRERIWNTEEQADLPASGTGVAQGDELFGHVPLHVINAGTYHLNLCALGRRIWSLHHTVCCNYDTELNKLMKMHRLCVAINHTKEHLPNSVELHTEVVAEQSDETPEDAASSMVSEIIDEIVNETDTPAATQIMTYALKVISEIAQIGMGHEGLRFPHYTIVSRPDCWSAMFVEENAINMADENVKLLSLLRSIRRMRTISPGSCGCDGLDGRCTDPQVCNYYGLSFYKSHESRQLVRHYDDFPLMHCDDSPNFASHTRGQPQSGSEIRSEVRPVIAANTDRFPWLHCAGVMVFSISFWICVRIIRDFCRDSVASVSE
uniref:Uncharacterized protein n=1 Tax=viral metagenome TaxID=1070528 RepID=A0A2V0RN84_9ZZZZ